VKRPDKPARSSLSGILNVNKPLRLTSMQVVSIVRRRAGGAKTGHAGTLDPLATGVLIIALGRATRTIDALMATTKRYRTLIDLSAITESHDLERPPEKVEIESIPTFEDIERALDRFRGRIEQEPPQHSAIQVGGVRAYEHARQGRVVELAARTVQVHEMKVHSFDWPRVEIEIHCDKGFYVRSFARDLGRALRTGGYCVSIERTAVGPFTIERAFELDDVPDPLREGDLMSVEDAMSTLRRAEAPS